MIAADVLMALGWEVEINEKDSYWNLVLTNTSSSEDMPESHKSCLRGLLRGWLAAVWEERRRLAHVISKRKGYPGGFRKGEHTNPAGEFKPGHKLSDEERARKSEQMKRWYRRHPAEARAKALKAWETRRASK